MGKLRRINDATKIYKNEKGEWHREDGPAFEDIFGYKGWYYYGRRIDCLSQEEFERIINLLIFE